MLDPLGFHLTRASLIERATYRESATGDHLALYVAPNAAANADEVAAAFPTLEQAGGADRFRRLRGLVVDGYLPGAARLGRIGAALDHHPRHHGRRVASSGVGNGDASTTRGARRR